MFTWHTFLDKCSCYYFLYFYRIFGKLTHSSANTSLPRFPDNVLCYWLYSCLLWLFGVPPTGTTSLPIFLAIDIFPQLKYIKIHTTFDRKTQIKNVTRVTWNFQEGNQLCMKLAMHGHMRCDPWEITKSMRCFITCTYIYKPILYIITFLSLQPRNSFLVLMRIINSVCLFQFSDNLSHKCILRKKHSFRRNSRKLSLRISDRGTEKSTFLSDTQTHTLSQTSHVTHEVVCLPVLNNAWATNNHYCNAFVQNNYLYGSTNWKFSPSILPNPSTYTCSLPSFSLHLRLESVKNLWILYFY